ncbi:hypothetical protein TrRE_jg12332, partial [Triparma retinervis]
VGGKRERGGWKDAVVWGLYSRAGGYNAVGLRAALTDRWLGQGFWGAFGASAGDFGGNEELEIDEEGRMGREGGGTRLLSGSAGWGKGAYLRWRVDKGKLVKGGGGDGRTEEGIGREEVGRFWVDYVDYQPPLTDKEIMAMEK